MLLTPRTRLPTDILSSSQYQDGAGAEMPAAPEVSEMSHRNLPDHESEEVNINQL